MKLLRKTIRKILLELFEGESVDLFTDKNPKNTIPGLKYATVKDAEASVAKIKKSGKSHAHKIQAAVALEQRAKVTGKKSQAAVFRKYINSQKKD